MIRFFVCVVVCRRPFMYKCRHRLPAKLYACAAEQLAQAYLLFKEVLKQNKSPNQKGFDHPNHSFYRQVIENIFGDVGSQLNRV